MKYDVVMSCGHDSTVDLVGKEAERVRKLEYYRNSGVCSACYKKTAEEQARAEGLVFNGVVLPEIDQKDGEILIAVWFSGNTKEYKDRIKSLGGYYWDKLSTFDNMISFNKPTFYWNKVVKFDALQDEITKAIALGATNKVTNKGLFSNLGYPIALKMKKEWNAKNEQAKLLKKPSVPEVLRGHRWNQKIYGKADNYSIYLEGNKVSITNEQSDEITRYLVEKEEYLKKLSAIKGV